MTRKSTRNPDTPELLSRDDSSHSYLWIGMIIFVATWTFLLGILVGRGTIPVLFDPKKIQVELAKRFDEAVQKKEAILKKYIDSPHPNLAFRDQLTRSDNQEHPLLPHQPPLPGVTAPAPPLTVGQIDSPHSEERAAEIDSPPLPSNGTQTDNLKILIRPKDEPKSVTHQPESLDDRPVAQMPVISTSSETVSSKNSGGDTITLHANPVPNKKLAEIAAAKLKNKGYDAQIRTRMISGKGIWYEVTVGNIGSRTEADALIMSLKQDNIEVTAR